MDKLVLTNAYDGLDVHVEYHFDNTWRIDSIEIYDALGEAVEVDEEELADIRYLALDTLHNGESYATSG